MTKSVLLNIKTTLLVLFALFVGSNNVARAQQNPFQLSSYVYSTGVDSVSGWLSPTLTYSSLVSGDDVASGVCNIGFNFVFEGGVYTQFSVNTNGNLRLGGVAISSGYYSVPFGSSYADFNTPKIVGVGADLYGRTLTYGVSGISPNRVGVFTYDGYTYGSTTDTFQFQVQLYENTGEIRIVYGRAANTYLNRSFQIGISSSFSDVAAVYQNTHTASYGSTSTQSSLWPGQYRYYSFA
ncbi:MAG: hypothetical protein IKX51_05890, partial [Bacteroidales bacterium]|nr:hypothetical protein [Bacteroidales bacterium]